MCPECGDIKLGERNTCDACGYSFSPIAKKTETAPPPDARSEYDSADIVELWRSRVPYEKTIVALFKWIPRIMNVVLFACLIIAAIIIVQYDSADAFEKLAEIDGTLSTLTVLSAGIGISMIFSDCGFFKTDYIVLRCSAWLRRSNFDILSYCKNKNIDTERMMSMYEETFNDCANSMYLRYNKKATVSSSVAVAVCAAIYMIAAIILSVGINESVNAIIAAVTLDRPISIEQFELVKLITPLVMQIAVMATQAFIKGAKTTKAVAWLDAELSADKSAL